MKKIIFLILLTTNLFAYNNKFVPKENKILLIIGQDTQNIQDYVNTIKIIPAGFMAYTSIQSMEGIYSDINYGAGVNNFQFLVKKYPNTAIQIGLWMVDGLEETLNGTYDENILQLANWAKSIKNPIYLRIGYEFDAPFNNYTPTLYIRTYKYLVDRLRKYKVNNISFVWHSYAADNNVKLENWYPGDEYVDWCAVSYFNQNQSLMYPMRDFAKKHNKPLMIAEATPRGLKVGVDANIWDKWYAPFFKFIYENNVKAVCYINANWDVQSMWIGQNWGDSRVQADKDIQTKWLNEINKNIFLNSSENLYKELN